jgi:hypothetical protein
MVYEGTGPTTETFNLQSYWGHVAIYLGNFNHTTGQIQAHGGSIDMIGASHATWVNTGVSKFTHGAQAKIYAGFGPAGPGSFEVSSGARLEFGYPPHSPVTVQGGTLSFWGAWGPEVTLKTVATSTVEMNFEPNPWAGQDEVTHYDIRDDILTLLDAQNDVVGSIEVHNKATQGIQVDKTSYGVAIVADNTPRPGMLPGHVG